jgi:CheY-like chemotaxis protein
MELMRTLRAEQAQNPIPVIAMSASASDYTREDALQAGCSVFISKPLRLTSLLEIVGAQLHLQWRYRASTAVRADEPSDLPVEPFQLDSELAGELQHLAMQGDILSLSARIEAALSGDDAARSFCAEIRALAAQYDIRGIRRMLTLSCSRQLS